MKKFITVLIIMLLLLLLNNNIIHAEQNIPLIVDKQNIKLDEELKLKINLNNIGIATFTIEIYFDNTKLEYINGPENSNYANNRIIYTWTSENGKNSNNIETGDFILKGKQEGNANIVAIGEFYDESGNILDIKNSNLEITIGTITQETLEVQDEDETNASSDNANLKIMRLNREGISPEFSSQVEEYYFVTEENISSFNITAIPENKNSTVTITGNENLKQWKNTISIKVESEDKSQTKEYKIYVTKTNNLEKANANLETLAIRQGSLIPEFDNNVTKYNIEIENSISKLDILAIPQREASTVKIIGNEEMKIGDNKIEIIVLAEDKLTEKKYEINVHRRNEQEEIENEEEQKVQVEKLTAILEQEEEENKIIEENKNKENNYIKSIMIIILFVAVAIIIGIIIYRKRKK